MVSAIHIVFLVVGLSTAIGLTINDTNATELPNQNETQSVNVTARRGRQIQEIIQLSFPSKKIKRQIIKIPPSVSKVKLVQPPLNLRHNRAPQQFNRYPPIYRSGGPWRAANKKFQTDYNAEIENTLLYDSKKVKRNQKKPLVKDVTPEEFYRDEEFDLEEEKQRPKRVKKPGSVQKVVKIKRKKPKKNILSDYLASYEGDDRLNYEEDEEMDSSTNRHAGGEENQSFHGYESAGSSIQMKQVPPPNLQPQMNFQHFYDENYVHGLNVKKLPTKGRQIQSLFAQQYTTHNPHVTTNFGLSEIVQTNGAYGHYGGKGTSVDASPYEFSQFGKYSQPIAASSDQVVSALPVGTPGIEVIQPPQFRDIIVSHPSHPSRLLSSASQQKEETSQKATIRDILEQDCPSFDMKGYCDSPPRYPMQQIKNMVRKCANLMEVMNTQPFEEPQEIYGFAGRSDNHMDNRSMSSELDNPSWSRSSSDGHTACNSILELIEPGYAKEANSARWFVIVQHPDTTIQRIATDTCKNPGKACGGLSELKCPKNKNASGKSTRCVQRHTYQRLISWDPESPEECPRMRVFKFPSACVCHLSVI